MRVRRCRCSAAASRALREERPALAGEGFGRRFGLLFDIAL
jgi:hypothetical protein